MQSSHVLNKSEFTWIALGYQQVIKRTTNTGQFYPPTLPNF